MHTLKDKNPKNYFVSLFYQIMSSYFYSKGLEWFCRTEEKTVRRAMQIGRKGKSCAEEIDDCEPKNIITDIVLLIDYFIV